MPRWFINALLLLVSHSVYLSWTASVTPGVTYNVYRADRKCVNAAGRFVEIANGVVLTDYTDYSVVAGVTYCYYVTAYLFSAEPPESTASNEAEVWIPRR